MQPGPIFLNTLAIIISVHSYLGAGAGAEPFPDQSLSTPVQGSGGESSSDFLANGLTPNYLVASSSDDASSRNLDPTDTTDQKDASLVNENSLSINTGDGCSSYSNQMNSKRMRRWDCGPDRPPNCCPRPGFTPGQQSHPLENQQSPKSTDQQESHPGDSWPTPVQNIRDQKIPFPVNDANTIICPSDIFGNKNIPTCDSGDPNQAVWHVNTRRRGPMGGPIAYYVLDDCFPFIPLFGCWWKPSMVWCCEIITKDKEKSVHVGRPYYIGWECLPVDQSLKLPLDRPDPLLAPVLPGPL